MSKSLKIGMMDADLLDNGTRHPNLAQMKMSAYCKSKGHLVSLIYSNDDLNNLSKYDLIIVSKVFTFTNLHPLISSLIFGNPKRYNKSIVATLDQNSWNRVQRPYIVIGGTGFFEDGGRDLDECIEHILPDYHLYDLFINYKISTGKNRAYYDDYENYSIGFTTRGCFRHCSFCVNKKYNRAKKHSNVREFFDPQRKKIYLWDDNLFAYHGWEEILNDLIATNRPFQFRQGLDIRMMSEKKAKKLSQCKYNGDFIFAFDHIEDRCLIEKKLKLWRSNCSKGTKLYILCAYDPWQGTIIGPDQDQKDLKDIENVFERVKILMEYDCIPYIMRYEKYKDSKYANAYVQIARWCNMPRFFKKLSFREFCQKNQDYTKSNRMCKTMRTMRLLELDAPEIAKKYFDVKYEKIEKKY